MARRRSSGKDPSDRGRFSARRKTEAVARLLRGEDIDTVSRELGVTAATLATWRDEFLAGGQSALKSRPAHHRDAEMMRLRAKVGELMMDNEVLEYGIRRYEEELGRPPFVAAEVEGLAHTTSASAGKTYGAERVCRCLGIPRSSQYWRRSREITPPPPPRQRGPRTYSDEELLGHVRQVLVDSPWVGEGYRKAWARLRLLGIRSGWWSATSTAHPARCAPTLIRR